MCVSLNPTPSLAKAPLTPTAALRSALSLKKPLNFKIHCTVPCMYIVYCAVLLNELQDTLHSTMYIAYTALL